MDKTPTDQFSSADITVLKKLLLFSLGMFVFPIGTFFLLQKTLPKDNVVIPVAGSVIAVHIVIGIYIWMAMKESADTYTEPLKQD
ncbi:Vacuolar ATPase assembly integral membrane vma21 [Paramuricea clavata]|uniref:Vacuolar ATPase assembly integral membrane vma21 n=1 Tax=Paramuricea clavata TaxID=317549 RepID=A0A6S7GJF7_PARCT|nr:Vacuolar ATPase assembly integral membrane vma21 [Paramuricea clavata]